ncbi:ABC transporter ATP-binding protein [Actinoplanes sp. TBRC 11911]|uniref:ABC transporter ATP-binding protein n=1 Tax=Actinoplanes sp. TBRC 11911 TaxID=2729386 RepID=UPI0020071B30|nr:ATP-binding cassette domain-containing protein [Actinoplanes sp. TBRC 11911]
MALITEIAAAFRGSLRRSVYSAGLLGLRRASTMREVVELRNVTFRRDNKEILHDVSFTVRQGEHWAMLGSNGAGKSTVLGFCGAVTHPTTGTVQVLGNRLGRVDIQTLRRSIGHVNPRHPLRSPLTVREVVLSGLAGSVDLPPRWQATGDETVRADRLIDMLGLADKAALRWPTLSQGERGRALIARALIVEPRLLLLDEPSTGLDVAAREQLLETVDLLEQTHPELASIVVTHHLEELPTTTSHALLLKQGRVVAAGTALDVLTTENVSEAFDHPINVDHQDGRWSARAARLSRTA